MMDLWQLSEIVSWVIVEVFVVRPSASLFESHQSPSPPSFHLAASSPFHSSLSSRPTSLPLSTTSTSDSVHRPRRPLLRRSSVAMSDPNSILPDSLNLPSHLSAHKYFFVCTLTVAAWDTLVLSPRAWRLFRTKEWPVLKIFFHILRFYMPIEFTIVGEYLLFICPTGCLRLSALLGVAFFDTKWSQAVSFPIYCMPTTLLTDLLRHAVTSSSSNLSAPPYSLLCALPSMSFVSTPFTTRAGLFSLEWVVCWHSKSLSRPYAVVSIAVRIFFSRPVRRLNIAL